MSSLSSLFFLSQQEPWNRLRQCWERVGGAASLYEDFGTLLDLVRQVLSRDIRSLHQRGAAAATTAAASASASANANGKERGTGDGAASGSTGGSTAGTATVYHLHLLGRIDISYVHEGKEIEVIDAAIV